MASPLYAATNPQNLGLGLDKLVESRAIVKANASRAIYGGYATEQAANYASLAITDETDVNRVLVDIVPTGRISMDAVASTLQASIPSMQIKSVDPKYRGTGVIEAYVSVDEATTVATTAGVKSVFLALKPYVRSKQGPVPAPSVVAGDHLLKIGTAFDQGVIQHRVDRISQLYNPSAPVNYDGSGISIGILSDSYDTRSASPHAATAVTNFDLPGAAANPWNTQPVVVLQDFPGGTDEGRGMTEIVYKMAPRARLAFATADNGEVGFANNIRALAALPGFTYDPSIQQGFKADVIADDVGYYDEPWYEDGIISDGIDDVAAAGTSYFSSAANDIGINGYESPLRIILNGTGLTAAAGNTALANTNISLSGVPANLYAGGFHNFNPSGLDVAQLVNYTGTQIVVMQWDDPYDSKDLTPDQPPIYSAAGTIDNTTTSVTYDQTSTPPLPPFVQGQAYVIAEAATSGNLDAIINIYDSSNNLVVSQDTGTDETVNFFAPATDQYRVVVNRYSTTTGNFTFTVSTAQGQAGVTTDLNLLVFNTAGAYQATRSLTSNNLANNRPIELAQFAPPSGQTQLQFVIARANTPTAAQLPTRVRWLIPGNGASGLGPAEYFTYNTVTTGGHPTAVGCNGTAAYSVFRPNVPESFTSPGPATILFDKQSKRLAAPDVRQQPRVAAADAGNTSFFSSDSTNDLDTNPNFSGTSAAAPHAAAIAALVLQSRGGSGSVTPTQMTSILQASAFPHDLDPSFASGTAAATDGGTVSVSISSDNDSNTATGQNDPSSFQITYSGPGSLASITFNPAGTDVAGGNVSGGNNGPMNDVGSLPATVTYFENNYPGLAFLPATKAFTLGPLTNLVAADVTVPLSTTPYTGFSNLAPSPANGTSQFRTMTIKFPNANFTTGAALRFTVGRGAQHSAVTGNGTVIGAGSVTSNPLADLFGGGVLIPSGVVVNDGMAFSGTTTAGGVFTGTIKNKIGTGYSVVDGYGFIDASVATGTLRGVASAAPASGYPNDIVLLTVNVTGGTNPASTGLAVKANLSGIGGSSSQGLYDDGTHGDAVAGDNVFSVNAVVGANAAPGSLVIPVTIQDNQSRSGNASINFTVLAATSPSGVGTATPAAVSVTETSLLTVAVTSGTGPVSTGIAVKADLSSIGGNAAQAFNDNGDGTFSFGATVPIGTAAGAKTLPVTVSDAQSRSSSTSISLSVLAPTALSASGSAAPSAVIAGGATHLSVSVTPGASPASSGIQVSADLTSIGGNATQALADDGSGTSFAFDATVDAATTPGVKLLPVTITDAQGRSTTVTLGLNVPTPGAPYATGIVVSGLPGSSVLLQAVATPGSEPTSTSLVVTVDLSAIGGSATQALYDDGTNGDQVAGDGVYSFATTLDSGTPIGATFNLPVTVSDAQMRTGAGSIQLTTLNDRIFGDGFE
ncbi:MAG: hypothetical protein P4L92_20825 [Rudaea sp.]|nr:hypothetical protein [Rudaea sp.]